MQGKLKPCFFVQPLLNRSPRQHGVGTMSKAHRDRALDCTKGIAIFAVVLFHVTRGFTLAGHLPESAALRFADSFAYGFHVQTFFLVAGFLAFPKAADARYQLGRQASFYYTYLLWSLISLVLSIAFSHAVNKPVGWTELAWMPIVPIQHFWFILALMFGTAVLGLLRTPSRLLGGAASIIALTYVLGPLHATGLAGSLGFYTTSLPFILIGGWLRQSEIRPTVTVPATLICLITFSGYAWWTAAGYQALTAVIAFPAMLTGCYVAYAVGTFASRTTPGEILAALGRHSYVIFLAHVIAGAGARIILTRLAPGLNLMITISISLAAAIILPMLFGQLARKMGLAILFGLDPLPLGGTPAHQKVTAS